MMTLVLCLILALAVAFILLALSCNRELRANQSRLVEMLGEAHRELAEAQQQARLRHADTLTIERYLETL